MAKNIFRVRDFLVADSADKLKALMLKNNLEYDTEFQYDIIFKDGQKWVAWYYRDISNDAKKRLNG